MEKEECDILAEGIIDRFTFWVDKYNKGQFYTRIYINNHIECINVLSSDFYAYLRNIFREESGEKFGYNFKWLIQAKTDIARFDESKKIVPYYRMAGNHKSITYFLANELHQCIVINSKGWKLKNKSKYILLKRIEMKKQVMPIKGGNLKELLSPFINMNENNFILFLIYLVQCFFYRSNHFVAIISSGQGSGKSTLTKLIQLLIDPSLAEKTLLPSSIEELKNHLATNLLVAFDNTKKLSDDFSDVICAATTGTTFTKRKLFTDIDMMILTLKNIIVLNGIDIVPKKADLLERSLLFELEKITPDRRMTDKEFWSNFKEKRAEILGAIFDTISKALAIRETLHLEETHRMSDAYTDMCAIALALDIPLDEFINIFNENIAKLEQTRSEENFFCNTIKDYLEGKQVAMKLLNTSCKVSEAFYAMKPSSASETKYFPKTASHFSRKLNEERSSLEKLGYSFKIDVKKDASYIEFFKI